MLKSGTTFASLSCAFFCSCLFPVDYALSEVSCEVEIVLHVCQTWIMT